MRQAAQTLAAARRTGLSFFLMKVFETLHPGENPLRLAWYVRAMCYALEGARAGRTCRLVITVPPPAPQIDHRLGRARRVAPRP